MTIKPGQCDCVIGMTYGENPVFRGAHMYKESIFSFTRVPAVILYECEKDNMTSDWVEVIIATRTKRGLIRVVARKWQEVWTNGGYVRKWQTLCSFKGIKTVEDFISAVNTCASELYINLNWSDTITQLGDLDENFRASVQKKCESTGLI